MSCYMKIESGCLLFGNEYFERKIQIDGPVPMSLEMTDKKAGKCWKGDQPVSLFCLSENADYVCRARSMEVGEQGLRVILECFGSTHSVEVCFLLFEDSPFFSTHLFVRGKINRGISEEQKMADGNENAVIVKKFDAPIISEQDSIEGFGLKDTHLQVKMVSLKDVTDRYNNLLESKEEWLYSFGRQTFYGSLFQFINPIEGTGFTLVKEAPCPGARLNETGADVVCYPAGYLCVRGSGLDEGVLDEDGDFCYGTAIGLCSGEEAWIEYKKFYQKVCCEQTYIMSNTWGDRNQDAAVCDSFIREEISCAIQLGADVVQIDDGWQKGTTANSKLATSSVWGSYYDAMPDFWAVNRDKFPQGLEPVIEYAKENKIKIGLWFSPDSTDSYSNWKRDGETLIDLYRRFGVTYFKLDGIHLKDKKGDRNLRRMVELVRRESEGAVDFNFDITAQIRWGYFYQKQHGKLFLENRYTDWGNYFPHDTLRNLWEISRYVPAQRMQIEVLNPRRNKDRYENDPFAPDMYSMDYLFGIAMVSNPLLWMEMSSLEEKDANDLQTIISCYKQYRPKLQKAMISPIGQKPSGMSVTGFEAELEQEGFLLLFRERTEQNTFVYTKANQAKVLYGDAQVESVDEGICVTIPNQRSFVLIQYQK